jgi:hypothetical protein
MRKTLGLIAAMAAVTLLAGCGTRKAEEVHKLEPFVMKSCPVTRIEVTPARVEDPAATIRSGFVVNLTAAALDAGGQEILTPLSWSLRYPDSNSDQASGNGQRLTVIDDTHAVFTASGLASGVFVVQVQDQSCDRANDNLHPQYPEGQAWIQVNDDPRANAACGRMRVTYGDYLDKMGDQVISGNKVTLMAEISGKTVLKRNFKVQFYVNEKPFTGVRPLYRSPKVVPAPEMGVGHLSLLPIYLTPGEYRVRYELLEDGQAICGSRVERFNAK